LPIGALIIFDVDPYVLARRAYFTEIAELVAKDLGK
jgi:hypothetical protein